MRSRTFFGQNSIPKTFYLKLFLLRCVFLAALIHKLLNVIFHISTYSTWEFSNPTDTSAKNVTLCGSFTELVEWNYLRIYTLYCFGAKDPRILRESRITNPDPQLLDPTDHGSRIQEI